MRGWDVKSDALFSYVNCEARVPKDHPLRPIRRIVDEALGALSPEFDQLYAKFGRPSIPPERLLRALLLQAFYSVRSELQLMEQLDYNLLFRWFVGLSMDAEVWDETVFTKNRERLIEGDIARKFMAAVLSQGAVKALLSDDHFSVDGTLIEAWASMKSFRPKDGSGEPPAAGRNGERDVHGVVGLISRERDPMAEFVADLREHNVTPHGKLDVHADCHCLQPRPASQAGGGRGVAMPAICPDSAKTGEITAKTCLLSVLRQLSESDF
jgi:transposase